MEPLVSFLCGGLGNQMFQYAAGRALALRLGVPLLLDTSWYTNSEGATLRKYMLDAFPIQSTIASEETKDSLKWRQESLVGTLIRRIRHRHRPYGPAVVQEPHFQYWSGFTALYPPAYLMGYWQSEHYFVEYAPIIKQDFTFPALPAGHAQKLQQSILEAPVSVAVHVRRGDYAQDAATHAMHGVCSSTYYATAIRKIKRQNPNTLLFLFSDDPLWVQEHFDSQGLPAIVVDLAMPNEPWHDMHLISLCKHHIIANSSFSWWGAWLGEREGKVYAPKLWFASSEKLGLNPSPERWDTI